MSERLKYQREQKGIALYHEFFRDSRNVHLFAEFPRSTSGKPMSVDEVADAVFARYREADPTRTGACMQWLIRLALAGNLPVEDLPKARETLEAFQTYKRRLAPEARDLGRHETLGAVWTAIEPFVRENAPASAKEEERRERGVVRAESTIVLERDGWTVAIPRTERASRWWGPGGGV